MVVDHYARIAPKSARASLSYQGRSYAMGSEADSLVLQDTIMEALHVREEDELTRGMCLVGPHRDDIELSLGELPVRGYASHGESWSYALSLKLASLDVLRADGVEPILILDDVFAELDFERRREVVSAVESVEQAFITVAVEQDIPSNLRGCILAVSPGKVTAVQQEES
jgi:DNA replication and repair protein RecF